MHPQCSSSLCLALLKDHIIEIIILCYCKFSVGSIVLTIIFSQLKSLIFADSDITYQYFEKYGKGLDSLKNKVIWITGASSGLGAALATTLAPHGAKLVLSARTVSKLNEVKEKCKSLGADDNNVYILPLDMLDYDKHQQAMDSVISQFGKIDVLVSNSGRSQRATWESIDLEVDKSLFEINFFALISLAKLVTKHFIANGGGHHVLTSSTAGKIGPPLSASYSASKHALHGYFETLRFERGSNIHVTMLCPGPFSSNLMEACFTDKLDKKNKSERSGKMMTADRCAYISGIAIANQLSEVWIAQQPVLLFHYISQYFPTFYRMLSSKIGIKMVMKLRDGNNQATKQE